MVDDKLLTAWRSIPAESFDPGLTEDELRIAEGYFAFRFPPDLRRLLGEALPVGDRFPKWKDPGLVVDRMLWPWSGIAFDIEHNNDRWPEFWGTKPIDIRDQFAAARKWFNDAPVLIPLFGHRYLPCDPCEEGNPVFSVYQMDIINYGGNLEDWIEIEFHSKGQHKARFNLMKPCRQIRAWTDVVEWC